MKKKMTMEQFKEVLRLGREYDRAFETHEGRDEIGKFFDRFSTYIKTCTEDTYEEGMILDTVWYGINLGLSGEKIAKMLRIAEILE